MKTFKNRTLIMTLVAVLALALLAPIASYASVEGRRNTTLGLAGLSAYLLLKGKTTAGLVAAAGTAVAYNKYKDAKDDDHRWYRSRDGRYYRSDSERDRADRRFAKWNDDRKRKDNGRHVGWYKKDRDHDRNRW